MISNKKQQILEHIKSFKSREQVPLTCFICGAQFSRTKQQIQLAFNTKKQEKIYCSKTCFTNDSKKCISKPCANCGKIVTRSLSQTKKNKSNNIFCNSSCASTYNNKHKKFGTRRSKLEIWLEEKLKKKYSNQKILFNDKSTIKSELDIYFPELKLAFELNGIFHYEPIFGKEKLNKIQANDKNKFQLCQQNQISLCIIDTSWISHNKESNFKKVLKIIEDILLELI